MRNVTVNELLGILAGTEVRGAKQATLLTLTYPKMLKNDRATGQPNPYPKGVSRQAYRQVTLGANYEACVNRQRLRENDNEAIEYFDALALWNGAGVYHSPYTVTHKTKGGVYFALKPAQRNADNNKGSVAVVLEDQWRDVASGQFIDPDRLENLLPLPAKAKRQEVQHDVQWRTFSLQNVVELHYGEVYRVIHA
jgi:hypothetical protein